MRTPWVLCALAFALCASALAYPSIDNTEFPPQALEKRVSETVTKIWTLENSQIALNYAGVISAIGLTIAALITSTSSGSSGCTIQADVVKVTSRELESVSTYNLTTISDSLHQLGFNVNRSAWSSNGTAIQYLDVLTNNQTAIHSLVISPNDLHFNVRVLSDEGESNLAARTTVLRTREIEVYYHASGQCYTIHTKAQVAVGIEDILARITHNDYYASCWALRFGSGKWHGHLKLLGLWSNGDVSTIGLDTSCTANS